MKRLFLVLLLAGCATAPPPKPAPQLPSPDTSSWYASAAAQGTAVYRIDPAASLIAIVVHRGGAMARFGHDHVVAARSVSGFAAPAANRADFRFRLDELTVDEPALRKEAGFDTQPDADAIAGTRTNMLTRVLDADTYPDVLLHAERDGANMRLSITLHGQTRQFIVPTTVQDDGATITAAGALALKQTDFGITPLSVMGGAIAVQDGLDLRFTVVARR